METCDTRTVNKAWYETENVLTWNTRKHSRELVQFPKEPAILLHFVNNWLVEQIKSPHMQQTASKLHLHFFSNHFLLLWWTLHYIYCDVEIALKWNLGNKDTYTLCTISKYIRNNIGNIIYQCRRKNNIAGFHRWLAITSNIWCESFLNDETCHVIE